MRSSVLLAATAVLLLAGCSSPAPAPTVASSPPAATTPDVTLLVTATGLQLVDNDDNVLNAVLYADGPEKVGAYLTGLFARTPTTAPDGCGTGTASSWGETIALDVPTAGGAPRIIVTGAVGPSAVPILAAPGYGVGENISDLVTGTPPGQVSADAGLVVLDAVPGSSPIAGVIASYDTTGTLQEVVAPATFATVDC